MTSHSIHLLSVQRHLAARGGGDAVAVGDVLSIRRERLARLDEDERRVVQPQKQLPQRRGREGAGARRLRVQVGRVACRVRQRSAPLGPAAGERKAERGDDTGPARNTRQG